MRSSRCELAVILCCLKKRGQWLRDLNQAYSTLDHVYFETRVLHVTYPGCLLGLGVELALLLQLREKDCAESEDSADAEAAHAADDERREVLQLQRDMVARWL